MSVIESIWISHEVDVESYLTVLQAEFGAVAHPKEAESFLIGDPPSLFRRPVHFEGWTYITGFDNQPLSDVLLDALVQHPELAPERTRVNWTVEQDRLFTGTLAEVRQRVEQETAEG